MEHSQHIQEERMVYPIKSVVKVEGNELATLSFMIQFNRSVFYCDHSLEDISFGVGALL